MEAAGVGRFDELRQFPGGGGGGTVGGEPAIDREEILGRVSMIVIGPVGGGVGKRIFEHGTDPEGAGAKSGDVIELGFDPFEGTALAVVVDFVPGDGRV